jgi:choline dehydrogenase-like flavoprotein
MDTTIHCDVCIVGAGAAGITVAHELRHSGRKVVLLESGGIGPQTKIQRLNEGEIVDPAHHGPLTQYRKRRFGGTTTVWGGWCAPFDEIDFESRPYVPSSGWPIELRDLDPYYRRAHDYCELGSYAYDVTLAGLGSYSSMLPRFSSEDVNVNALWRCSPPTNFGRRYRESLKRAGNIEAYRYATALSLVAISPSRIERVIVGCLTGNRFAVRARRFVLATGGLEVPRLLLLSNDLHPTGLGNDHDLVGRFYLSHLSGDVGDLQLTPGGGKVIWNYERGPDRVYCRRRFSIRPETQRREKLLNFSAMLDRPSPEDPSHGSGVLSAMFLVKRVMGQRSRRASANVTGHLRNLVVDLPSVARFSGNWLTKRTLSRRRLPSVVIKGKANVYGLHYDAEQSPNPDSRVSLSEDRDPFGLRRLKVDWRFREDDVESVVGSATLIDQSLRASGAGRLLRDADSVRDRVREMANVGSHHLGTTRMSDHPQHGVVDSNCRVHGIENLYIASSSVFPTASYARPTLTIVALAIRLADHLKELSR